MSRGNARICIFTLGFLILMSMPVLAKTLAMDLIIDGEVVKYSAEEVVLKVDGKTVVTNEMPPIIISERTLVPAREMFESMGATVEWDNDTRQVDVTLGDANINLTIGSEMAIIKNKDETSECKLEVTAKIINNKTMIPFRAVAESIGCNVEWIQETRTILVNSPSEGNEDDPEKVEIQDEEIAESVTKDSLVWNASALSKIEATELTEKSNERANIIDVTGYFNDADFAKIVIKADGPVTKVIPSTYDKMLILDITNSNKVVTSSYTFNPNDYVTKFRASQYTTSDTRCVFDLASLCSYSVNLSSDRTQIIVKLYKTEITRIEYTESDEEGTLIIEGTGLLDTKVARLTDKDRIYIDIYNAISYFGDKTSTLTKSDFVDKIRTSNSTSTMRIVLDTNDQYVYEYEKLEDNKLQVKIKKPTYENVKYSNSKTYKLIVNTEDFDDFDVSDLEINEDYINGEYSIVFPSDYSDEIGEGSLNVYDSKLESFEILEEKSQTVMKFNTTSDIIIALDAYMDRDDLIIEILSPGEKYDEVLVIDPGHGLGATGKSDTGAAVGTNYEKNFNLDIALQVAKRIEEESNIKVYLTRTEDQTFANYIVNYNNSNHYLYGRAQLANTIDADMFISIHNNSMGTEYPKWNGTEVLYNSNKKYADGTTSVNGLTNKTLATILSKAIVEGTGGLYKNNQTDKRTGENIEDGVTLRTDLAVLNLAEMPASLIELAFLTNPDDLAKLKDPDYITNVSNIIGDTIISVFEDYDLDKN